jgi:SnoaL-like domain
MDLAVLEDIRQLKYRYLRCVDQKLWDELADVFTPGATVDYGTRVYGKPLKLAGRDEIIAFFRANLGPQIITVHAAGQPEITVDGDKASGTWRFEDTVIATEHRVVIAGAAYYQDRYERGADGAWRIAHTGYVRTYEAMMSLDDLPSFKFLAGVPKAAKTSAEAPSASTPSANTGTSVADAAVR